MGQTVAAIVYGVLDGFDKLDDEDGEWLSEPPLPVEKGGVADLVCLGLTIAVQNVPEDGEAEMPECAIEDISTELNAEIQNARDDWKQIVAWAKSHKVTLPKPRLLLMSIERA